MSHVCRFLCALGILVAAQGESVAQDASAKVNVLWRKAVSTDGSNQGTAYTMSNRIITARGRVFVAWLDHVADIVIQTYDLETRLWGEKVVLGKGSDNHCAPAITMDNAGYLYAMFGPHNAPFQFRRSQRPYDATAWGPIERFGTNGTYPSLVCGPDDTLHCAYRGGRGKPLRLIYHRRPQGETWGEPRELVTAAVPDGYTQYTNSLAVSADDTLHLAFHIYDKHPAGGKAVGYLRSRDGGDTWESADGQRIEPPATPAAPCFVERGKTLDMRCSNVALDPDGRPWLIAWHMTPKPMSARLWHHDGHSWTATELLPIVRTAYPEQEMAWMGTLTFDQSGRLYIATVIQHPPFSWGAPSQEVILLTSDDRGKTFDVLAVSEPDPEVAHWFPSIERPFGPAPIGMPSLLYCHSRPSDRKTRMCEPGEILFVRLGTRD